jgi:hypothetical protein
MNRGSGIVADIFETLGGSAKSAAKGAAKGTQAQIKKGAEDVVESLGVGSSSAPEPGEPPAAHNDEQLKKIEKAAQMRQISRYKEIREEIRQLQKQREEKLPAYITGQPGFDEEKVVKQLEVGAPDQKKAEEGKKPAALPISVKRAQRKTERRMGPSG